MSVLGVVVIDSNCDLELTGVYVFQLKQSFASLTNAIVTKNGSFYLCGQTWPIPDITACLEDIVRNETKNRLEEIKVVTKRRLQNVVLYKVRQYHSFGD